MFYNIVFCRRETIASMCPAGGFATSMEVLQKSNRSTSYGCFIPLLLKKEVVICFL